MFRPHTVVPLENSVEGPVLQRFLKLGVVDKIVGNCVHWEGKGHGKRGYPDRFISLNLGTRQEKFLWMRPYRRVLGQSLHVGEKGNTIGGRSVILRQWRT